MALCVGLVLACVPAVSAEDRVYFGALGGASFTHLAWTPEDEDVERSNWTRPAAGAFAGLELGDIVCLEARVFWLRKGAQMQVSGDPRQGRAFVEQIAVPVLVRAFLVAGPELAFKRQARLWTERGGVRTDDDDFDSTVASTDVALDIGAGVEIPAGGVSLVLEGLYSHGLKDIADDPDDEEVVKTRTLYVTAGVRF